MPPAAYRRGMRIAVLGPLEVLANDSAPVGLPGAQERLLLGVLAAGAPGVVATDRLTETLGNGQALQATLRRLRSAWNRAFRSGRARQYVLRRGHGLALAVARADIDALRFADLVVRGRARLRGRGAGRRRADPDHRPRTVAR